MSGPPPLGPGGRLAARCRQEALDAEAERKLAKILLEVGADLPERETVASAGDDARKLRGLPVVGVHGGMGGAIEGTRPDVSRELDEWPRPDP